MAGVAFIRVAAASALQCSMRLACGVPARGFATLGAASCGGGSSRLGSRLPTAAAAATAAAPTAPTAAIVVPRPAAAAAAAAAAGYSTTRTLFSYLGVAVLCWFSLDLLHLCRRVCAAAAAARERAAVNIKFIKADGTPTVVAAAVGDNLLEVAHANNIDIEGESARWCCCKGLWTPHNPVRHDPHCCWLHGLQVPVAVRRRAAPATSYWKRVCTTACPVQRQRRRTCWTLQPG